MTDVVDTAPLAGGESLSWSGQSPTTSTANNAISDPLLRRAVAAFSVTADVDTRTVVRPALGRHSSKFRFHDSVTATAHVKSSSYRASAAGAASRMETTRPSQPDVRVSGMEKWQGLVKDVDEHYFTVDLTSLDDPQSPRVLAEFDLDLIPPDDDLNVGDVVYVTVRTVKPSRGYPTKTCSIRLRRSGVWREDQIAEIHQRALAKQANVKQYFD